MKLQVTPDYRLMKDGEPMPWPILKSLRPYLSRPIRRNAGSMVTEIRGEVVTKEEALRAVYGYLWHRDRITNQDDGVTLESDHPGSVFLAMGETLYELHPVKSIGNSKALSVARQKAMTVAKAEAAATIELAEAKACNVREEAQRTMYQARTLLESHSERTRGDQSIGKLNFLRPGVSVKLLNIGDRGTPIFCLYVPVNAQFLTIDSWSKDEVTKKLDSPYVAPVNVEMAYVWANGEWSLRPSACRLDSSAITTLPHLTTKSACFTLGDAATSPVQASDVVNTAVAMLRAMSVVNFDSLLSPNVDQWPEELVSRMPKEFIECDAYGHSNINWPAITRAVSSEDMADAPDLNFHIAGARSDSV